MARSDAEDGLSVTFTMDRLVLSLLGGEGAPFAGAVGLAGALSVSVPEALRLVGFVLVVQGHLERSAGSQALVTCSIGHGTSTVAWPLVSLAGAESAEPSRTREGPPAEDSRLSADFRLECFTSDFNPASVGVPPHPPLPPFPLTVSMQARRRAADEAIDLGVSDFSVILVTS
jgi:hypothetical protein